MIKSSFLFFIALASFFFHCAAQDVAITIKEAENLERSLKEPEALDKYKLALANDAKNIKALVKATELSLNIGGRSEEKNDKRLQFESAMVFAKRAFQADSNNTDACYAMGIASAKLIETESDNKKIVGYVKDSKRYLEKAVKLNPNNAKANFALGRWYYEMATLSSLKKAATKIFYGGLPDATVENAISYFEKCKSLDPYMVINYYFLNKAYKETDKPTKQIEVLNRLVKLPNRCVDDVAMKADATKQLQDLQ